MFNHQRLRLASFGLIFLSGASLSRGQTFPERMWQVGPADLVGRLVRQADDTVTLAVGGKNQTASRAQLGTEDLRYLREVGSVKFPYRTWTRTYRKENGEPAQETFSAALVDLPGFDSPLSKRYAVMVRLDSGKRRGYAITDLSALDKAYIATVTSQFPAPPAPNDGEAYLPNFTEYVPGKTTEKFSYKVTDHFIFYWGDNIQPDGQQWKDPAFREMNFAYFEKVWNYFHSINATTPYYNQVKKYKTNVYISRTGLSKHPDGFAFGGESILICPGAMLEGSSVVPHEFGHTMQLASGGYRNSPYVGWFWENHGNWCSSRFIPGVLSALDVYAQRAHYELDSSRMNYGSWPIVEYYASHPKFTPAIAFDVWREARRNADTSATETPLETFARLGVERGVFKDAVQGFGDMVGEMGAHNATWDYTFQQAFIDDLVWPRTQGAPWHGQTILRPVPDRPGYYRPMYTQTPRQYGINIIDLDVKPGAKTVGVNFDGIADEVLRSNWRVTLVAVDANGNARYSRMWRTGKGHLDLNPGETVKLAIAAAPDQIIRTEFRPGYNKQKRHFPYEVSFTGCTPSTRVIGVRSHAKVAGHAHPNGGGFVADSARVDASAYVAPGAQVLDAAQVTGNARILDHATVAGGAKVSDNAIVSGSAYVAEGARVGDTARVTDYAVVMGQARVVGNARVREAITISGNGMVEGDALVKGFGNLYTSEKAALGGGAIAGQDSEIYMDTAPGPVRFGTLYGFMSGEQMARDISDNHYLYAHWDFKTPQKRVLYDALTDNDGVLRGGATLTSHRLRLDGKTGYAVVEGHPIDAAGVTFDFVVNWRGGKSDQRLFAFGGGNTSIGFTPLGSTGKAGLIVRRGTVKQVLWTKSALPKGKPVRVTVAYNGEAARIYLDGKLAAGASNFTIPLVDLRTDAGYLGRDITAGPTLNGDLLDAAIYRKAFDTFTDLIQRKSD